MVKEADVRKALRKVKDPEMNLDLVVLGLIYGIDVKGSHVDVTMSLTSPGCPVAGDLLKQAQVGKIAFGVSPVAPGVPAPAPSK